MSALQHATRADLHSPLTPHLFLLLLLLRRSVRRRTSVNGSAATAENADVAQAEASLEALVEEEAAMPPVAPDR